MSLRPHRLTHRSLLRAGLFGAATLGLTGCDWAAADGPWNRDPTPPPAGDGALVGTLCTPDGRPVPAAELQLEPADGGDGVGVVTELDGHFEVAGLAPGSWSLDATVGHFSLQRRVEVSDAESDLAAVCLDPAEPRALVLRGPDAAWADRVLERLRGFELAIAHAGTDDAALAASLLATPQGLGDYDVAALGSGLASDAIVLHDGAMGGLRDFLGRGGGLYLSGDTWPILQALVPGSLAPHEHPADHDRVEVQLLGDLAWHAGRAQVELTIVAGQALFAATGADVEVLAEGRVLDAAGDKVDSPLLLRVPVGDGAVVYSALRAPEPADEEWWVGDGVGGDLRGGLIDHLLLRL